MSDYSWTNIRHVSDTEQVFILSLMKYPEIADAYKDLEHTDFTSDFPYIMYKEIIQANLDDVKTDSCLSLALELKDKNVISRDEYLYLIDKFGKMHVIDSYSADKAYKLIKAKRIDGEIQRVMFTANNAAISRKEKLVQMVKHLGNAMDLHGEEEESKFTPLAEVIEKIKKDGVEPNVLWTGFHNLDPHINIKKDNLIIVSARTGIGKTHFILNWMYNQAKIGKKSLFYTLEMGAEEIALRLMKMKAKTGLENIMVVDKEFVTIETIMRDVMLKKPDFIVIDQLNKVRSYGKDSREKRSNAILELKEKTKKLHIPMVVVAQLNRAGNEEPDVTHLKDSGSIEEEADKVIIIHRDKFNSPSIMNIIVAKNRQGREGMERLYFNKETFRISDSEEVLKL